MERMESSSQTPIASHPPAASSQSLIASHPPAAPPTLAVRIWAKLVDNAQALLITIIGGYVLLTPTRTRNVIEGLLFGFVGVSLIALNFRYVRQLFTYLRGFWLGFATIQAEGVAAAEGGAAANSVEGEIANAEGETQEDPAAYRCDVHGKSYTTFDELIDHAEETHKGSFYCRECAIILPPGDDGTDHFDIGHTIGYMTGSSAQDN